MGECNISVVHGSTHKYVRSALLPLISPTMVRDQLLPTIDQFVRSYVSNWDNQVMDIQQKIKEMAFLSSLQQVVDKESMKIKDKIMPEYFKLFLGTISLPIPLPGTNYSRGLQARKAIVRIIREVMEERR
ncbi:hypothetical protein PIB30_007265 [Stylosanthes scabra]|uniref:Uncharacterized protein n=1 Tax=Stylosanthes scabra TaxID=79078 RepID=A0ABU6W2K8_9FABA|nr:hypothetical protein [Stylosanthes scabra]